ncbi:hypothetical protein BJ912DRAFT_1046282 [Pholiota molesta]|nr:hypothetical protein BJ912DRAFT_1046282 [Pholiota molesta]
MISTKPQPISTYLSPSSATSPKRDEHKHNPVALRYSKVRSADADCSTVTVVVASFRGTPLPTIYCLSARKRVENPQVHITLRSDIACAQSDDRNSTQEHDAAPQARPSHCLAMCPHVTSHSHTSIAVPPRH